MAEIEVTRTGPEQFRVTLVREEGATHYEVVVPPSLMGDRLKLKWVDCETVVRESFVYLLEREDPAALKRAFALDAIASVHPDYFEELHRRLSAER